MQAIYKNEDERGGSRKADSVDAIVYAGRIGEYLERKYVGRSGREVIGI